MTHDHSVVGILLRQGGISPEQALSHPARGQLSRYVGMGGEVLPDVKSVGIKKGDQLLLCLDGLTGMLSDEEISAVISRNLECQETCQQPTDAANAKGGHDNITEVLLR